MSVFIIYIILAPGALENIGVMDLVVQPLRVELATINTLIVQQAYFLNAVVMYAYQKGHEAEIIHIEVDVDLFNVDQENTVIQYDIKYTTLVQALKAWDDDAPYPFCDPFNVTLLHPDYAAYDCSFTTIEARVYTEINLDQYEQNLSSAFDVYVGAFREAVLVTVYCLAGFIAFMILIEVISMLLLYLLRRFNAIKINRKRWYVEVEQEYYEGEDEDEYYDQKREVKKMLKRCGTAYGDEVSMRFLRVLDDINQLKTEFTDVTLEQIRAMLLRENSQFIPTRQPDLSTESRVDKFRRNIFSKIKRKFTARRPSLAPSASGTIELMNREGSANLADSQVTLGGSQDLDETKILENKLHALKMLELQLEELHQWIYNKFPNTLDFATLQDCLSMIQCLSHDPAIIKNLILLEGMVLNLLDRFKAKNLPQGPGGGIFAQG